MNLTPPSTEDREFVRLQCKQCYKHFHECPQCFVIFYSPTPHSCFDQWFTDWLYQNIPTPPTTPHISLSEAAFVTDNCRHRLKEFETKSTDN